MVFVGVGVFLVVMFRVTLTFNLMCLFLKKKLDVFV